jgi:hypothetical protein
MDNVLFGLFFISTIVALILSYPYISSFIKGNNNNDDKGVIAVNVHIDSATFDMVTILEMKYPWLHPTWYRVQYFNIISNEKSPWSYPTGPVRSSKKHMGPKISFKAHASNDVIIKMERSVVSIDGPWRPFNITVKDQVIGSVVDNKNPFIMPTHGPTLKFKWLNNCVKTCRPWVVPTYYKAQFMAGKEVSILGPVLHEVLATNGENTPEIYVDKNPFNLDIKLFVSLDRILWEEIPMGVQRLNPYLGPKLPQMFLSLRFMNPNSFCFRPNPVVIATKVGTDIKNVYNGMITGGDCVIHLGYQPEGGGKDVYGGTLKLFGYIGVDYVGKSTWESFKAINDQEIERRTLSCDRLYNYEKPFIMRGFNNEKVEEWQIQII